MKRSSEISVIIPAYNAGVFIRETLDSVLTQTLMPLEVLVVNDGSSDDTKSIIGRYAKEHPQLPITIFNQKNKGIGAARNKGLFKATGHFVAFLDADDLWYPNKTKAVQNIIARYPKVDVIYHNEIEFNMFGNEKLLSYKKLSGDAFYSLLFSGNKLSTSATTVNRALAVDIGGFSENLSFNGAEDYEFWLRLAKNGGIFFHLDEILGKYRRSSAGITTRVEYHASNSFNVVNHHLRQLFEEGKLNASEYRRVLRSKMSKNAAGVGRTYYLAGDFNKAIQYYITSIKRWPLYWKGYVRLIQSLIRQLLA